MASGTTGGATPDRTGCHGEVRTRRARWRRLAFGFRGIAGLVVVCCFAALAPGRALAEDSADAGAPSAERFGWGKKHVALNLGYGLGFRTGSKQDRELSRELGDVSLIELVPRLGIGVTDTLGGDGWFRGNFEFLFEGALIFNTRPHFGYAVGGGSTLRYNFLAGRSLVPFVDCNLGIVYLDFDLAGQSDGFNFNVGWGSGLHWFVSERMALTPEVRYQHFSNAGIQKPNHGINDVLFLIGISYFLD
jgi:opacity protein-like surface antigen